MFRMDTYTIALQQALAAEIRSRLGRMNRPQSWLQREANVPAPTWRRYFTDGSITREVPMPVVMRIADKIGMTGSQLTAAAEAAAEQYAIQLMAGPTEAERADLQRAAGKRKPRSNTEQKKGRSASGE